MTDLPVFIFDSESITTAPEDPFSVTAQLKRKFRQQNAVTLETLEETSKAGGYVILQKSQLQTTSSLSLDDHYMKEVKSLIDTFKLSSD
jgi:hypothetical protein